MNILYIHDEEYNYIETVREFTESFKKYSCFNINTISLDKFIEKIKDDDYLQNMADRAYKDIIENGNYTYKDFIEYFDSVVNSILQICNIELCFL